MRLGAKLILAFLAVALIPAGGVLSFTWRSLSMQFDKDFEQRLEGIRAGLMDELARMGERLSGKLQVLTESDELERILVDMVRERLDRRALVPRAGVWMRTFELDLLYLLDAGGNVLSCGHLPARSGGRDEAALELISRAGSRPAVFTAQVLRAGTVQTVLAIAVAQRRRFNEAELQLVGGSVLDEGFAARLEKLAGAAVRIVDASGGVVAMGAAAARVAPEDWVPGPRLRRVPLSFVAGSPAEAWVELSVSRVELETTRQRIVMASALAASVSVLLSFLLGLVFARRVTRPVLALVSGARAVARGERQARVPGRYSAELGELVSAFNRMLDDLSTAERQLIRAERVAAWQEIARRIAHEIKNPLSPIQMSIETMRKAYAARRPDFDEIFEESTRAILEEVAALKRIVTEFSEFARLPKPSLARLELNAVVEGVLNLYRNQSPGLEVTFTPGAGLPEVNLDREQWSRALANVLTNAVQAMDGPGKIEVSTGAQAERVFVRIADSGRGMAPEVLARVFTPYFTTRQDGTGLGLAIVQRIVEEHGGRIEIESQAGRGSAVSLWLTSADAPRGVDD